MGLLVTRHVVFMGTALVLLVLRLGGMADSRESSKRYFKEIFLGDPSLVFQAVSAIPANHSRTAMS
jgi:hypothetical protein